jgi:hypothetical protein
MTENIKIDGAERSPEIDFDFEANTFHLKGESYPEDITAFYGQVIDTLEEHLAGLKGATVRFTFELIYFNSSTAKVLMGLFDSLDETAGNGNDVTVIWVHESDDDNMEEMGEEFGEDLEHAKFELKAVEV